MMELEKREKERLIRERIDAISNYVGEKEKKKKKNKKDEVSRFTGEKNSSK